MPKFTLTPFGPSIPLQPALQTAITTPAPGLGGLPNITPTTTGISSPLTTINALLEDEDDDSPDTTGFLYNDENIFETGGLNKSSHKKVLRHPAIPTQKRKSKTPVRIPRPGDQIFMNGEYYDFLGYLGDEDLLSDEELNSFVGEGEFSDFAFLKKLFKGIGKAGKKLGKSKFGRLAGTGLLGGIGGPGGLALGTALFRKRKRTVRFDGYNEYEYFIGPSPEFSDFKFLKKIGKAIGKAGKAVGKVGKAVVTAPFKAGKAVVKGIKAAGTGLGNFGKWVGRSVDKVLDSKVAMAKAEADAARLANLNASAAALNSYPLDYQPNGADMYSPTGGVYDDAYGPQYGIGGANYQPTSETSAVAPAKNNTIIYIALAVVVALAAFLIYKKSKK